MRPAEVFNAAGGGIKCGPRRYLMRPAEVFNASREVFNAARGDI